ncbi:hypothetical protein E2979_08575 [Paracoccus yeei]
MRPAYGWHTTERPVYVEAHPDLVGLFAPCFHRDRAIADKITSRLAMSVRMITVPFRWPTTSNDHASGYSPVGKTGQLSLPLSEQWRRPGRECRSIRPFNDLYCLNVSDDSVNQTAKSQMKGGEVFKAPHRDPGTPDIHSKLQLDNRSGVRIADLPRANP